MVRVTGRGRRILKVLAAIPLMLVVLVAGVYVWPLGEDELRSAPAAGWDFATASAAGTAAVQADIADPQVLPECRTTLRSHGVRTGNAVLLLHGYTDCPKQFDAFAEFLFDHGYNVYTPRAPRHGVRLGEALPGLTATELAEQANQAMNVVAGLGDQVGVIGMSGGGVQATWLAEYRPDVVTRLLVLSPFYRPAPSQAPAPIIKPFTLLYGHRLLPDRRVPGTGSTYSELAQYLRVAANLHGDAQNDRLRAVAVVVSEGDTKIDRDRAVAVPRRLAEANQITPGVLTLDGSFGHDIVEATDPGMAGRAEPMYEKYLALYGAG